MDRNPNDCDNRRGRSVGTLEDTGVSVGRREPKRSENDLLALFYLSRG